MELCRICGHTKTLHIKKNTELCCSPWRMCQAENCKCAVTTVDLKGAK